MSKRGPTGITKGVSKLHATILALPLAPGEPAHPRTPPRCGVGERAFDRYSLGEREVGQ